MILLRSGFETNQQQQVAPPAPVVPPIPPPAPPAPPVPPPLIMAVAADHINNFRAVIGIHQATADFCTDAGYDSLGALVEASFEEIDGLKDDCVASTTANVNMTSLQARRLKIAKVWATVQLAQNQALDGALFDAAMQTTWMARLRQIEEIRRKAKNEKTSTEQVVTIEKFEKLSEWETMKAAVNAAMKILRSNGTATPLTYLLRDPSITEPAAGHPVDVSDPNGYNGDFDAMLIETISISPTNPAQLRRYVEDNGKLWDMIHKVTIDTPMFSYIRNCKRNRDGRRAYLKFKNEGEGRMPNETRKTEAYAKIKSAHFNGKSPRFTFNHYIQRLTDAYTTLEECNEAVPETKKVNDFLAGISDPKLSIAKGHIIGDAALMANFEDATQYASTWYNTEKASTAATTVESRRTVSQVDTKKKKADKKDEREAGAASKTDNGERKSSGVNWKDPEYLSASQFAKLEPWERKARKELIDKLVAEGKIVLRKDQKKNKPNGKRKTRENGAVETESPSKEEETVTVPQEAAAGTQFGRGAHVNKKQAVNLKSDDAGKADQK